MATRATADMDLDRYLKLVREFPLRPIRSEPDLDRAIAFLDRLTDREDLGAGERDYQLVLATLIAHYEDRHEPEAAVSPAAMLRHLIDARGTTQAKLAADLGLSESTVSEILAGKRGVSPRNRRLFADHFGVEPGFFA